MNNEQLPMIDKYPCDEQKPISVIPRVPAPAKAGGGESRMVWIPGSSPRMTIVALRYFSMFIVYCSLVIVLSSCGTFYEDSGSQGQPCFGDGSCDGGLACCDGVCRDSCGADGDTDFPATDGDEDPVIDGDRDEADGEPSDGDEDTTPDGDEESSDDDPECECATVDDCCDGCHYTTVSCTPDDENALGGTCSEGICLIDACKGGWHVSLDRLSCEEDSVDGDEEIDPDGDGDDDPDIPVDGDDDLQPDGDEEIEPDGDLDPESDGDVEDVESDIEAGSLKIHGAPIRPSATGADDTRTMLMKLRWCPGVWRK